MGTGRDSYGDTQGQLWGHPVPTSSTPLVSDPRGKGSRCCFGGGTPVTPSGAGGDRRVQQSDQAALGAPERNGVTPCPSLGTAQGQRGGASPAAAAAVPAGHGAAGHRGRAGLGFKATLRLPRVGWGLAGAVVLSSISWSSLGGVQALLGAVVAGAELLLSPPCQRQDRPWPPAGLGKGPGGCEDTARTEELGVVPTWGPAGL